MKISTNLPLSATAGMVLTAMLAALTLAAAENDAPPAFEPGEISIGEPMQLPMRADPAQPLPPAEPLPPSRLVSPADAAGGLSAPPSPFPANGSAAAGGNGWIGLTVDDKVVTGRLVIVDVAAGGPAAAAGITVQDHLLAINGVPLRTADQLAASLAAISPGSDVKVAVGRADRIDEITMKAVSRPSRPASREWQAVDTVKQPPLTERLPSKPEPARVSAPTIDAKAVTASPATGDAKGRTALGVRTRPVDPEAQARFQLAEPAGALVIGVVQDLPASKAGVPPGSVIVALDNQPVRSPNELTQIVTSGPVDRPVTLQYVLPGGEKRRAEVSLQSLEIPLERALVGPER